MFMLNARRSFVALAMVSVLLGASIAAADEKDRNELPRGAKAVAEASGEGRFKAPTRGGVWLWDPKEEKVLASATIGEGDTFAFNAKEDRVYINGKEVDQKVSMDNDRTMRIYFLSTEKAAVKDKPDRDSGRPVPDTAEVVEEGRDKELSYVAKARGTAYLYDASHDKLLETFNLSAGDRITVSSRGNAISVNGKTVSREIELDRKVTYKLLFDVKK